MPRKIKYQVLDLFAGCGGLSTGFADAGFNIAVANEFWKPAQLTYAKNHPNTILIGGDVTDEKVKAQILKTSREANCEVIIGGPPCQAYSQAGRRNAEDPRGRLFENYVELVAELSPLVFVMENVTGLLSMLHDKDSLSPSEKVTRDAYRSLEKEKARLLLLRKQHKNNSKAFVFGKQEEQYLGKVKAELAEYKRAFLTFQEPVVTQILNRFASIGYKVQYQTLNAANYGVPQRRERVIFIGTKLDVPIIFPKPTHTGAWVTVRQAIGDLTRTPEDKTFSHIFTTHSEAFLAKLRATPVGKSVFSNFSDSFFRNPPDEPARTVKENHGAVLVHYELDRVMTPRELARLQSFPDDFYFCSTKSMILKQIGNAVPPLLGKAIGQAVSQMLQST